MTDEEMTNSLRRANLELDQLKARLDELSSRTMVISPSFLKRAFAIYGHSLVAGLIIIVPIWVVMALIVAAGVFLRPH